VGFGERGDGLGDDAKRSCSSRRSRLGRPGPVPASRGRLRGARSPVRTRARARSWARRELPRTIPAEGSTAMSVATISASDAPAACASRMLAMNDDVFPSRPIKAASRASAPVLWSSSMASPPERSSDEMKPRPRARSSQRSLPVRACGHFSADAAVPHPPDRWKCRRRSAPRRGLARASSTSTTTTGSAITRSRPARSRPGGAPGKDLPRPEAVNSHPLAWTPPWQCFHLRPLPQVQGSFAAAGGVFFGVGVHQLCWRAAGG
jgi:hypothetical protein